jgi:hypothetical protein
MASSVRPVAALYRWRQAPLPAWTEPWRMACLRRAGPFVVGCFRPKADSQGIDDQSSRVLRCAALSPSVQCVQDTWSTAGLTPPYHLLFGGLLDLLGLRDGVFPGVVLLSRRR